MRRVHVLLGVWAIIVPVGRLRVSRDSSISGLTWVAFVGKSDMVSRKGTMGGETWMGILANRSRKSVKHRYFVVC